MMNYIDDKFWEWVRGMDAKDMNVISAYQAGCERTKKEYNDGYNNRPEESNSCTGVCKEARA